MYVGGHYDAEGDYEDLGIVQSVVDVAKVRRAAWIVSWRVKINLSNQSKPLVDPPEQPAQQQHSGVGPIGQCLGHGAAEGLPETNGGTLQ